MLVFGLCSTSDDQAGRWTQTPSPAKIMKCSGLHSTSDDWLGRSMDSNPISSQNNEMLIFGLCSTSDDGWAGRWTQTPSATPLQPKT